MATSAPCEKKLFEYTRGRFLLDEANQMARRRVHFNMSELASVAAKSVGAEQCVDIEKCPDGLFNKAYILTMNNGKQVIGKIPNPNAGIPYYTIASEVATMDFARNVLGTPTPHVYAWDGCRSGVGRNSVGAEFIIMEKVPGVPLASLWWKLEPREKLKILLQAASFQKRWVEVQFTKFGSLYYAESITSRGGESQGIVGNPRFAIGPAVGREWSDEGRQNVQCDRGPWDSIVSYRKAIALREMKTVKTFQNVPKQMAMIYGPKPLYQPSSAKKLAALEYYLQILPLLLPEEPALTRGYLWHDDLHHENIFIDPQSLQIVGIIDWQSIQVTPLFDHCLDPCFLDYEGPDVGDNLQRPELPESVKWLEGEEKARALREFTDKGVMIGWRTLFKNRMPDQYPSIEFQQSARGNILHLSRRIFELGEAHLHALLLDLQDEYDSARVSNPDAPRFPLEFSKSEIAAIETDMRRADLGIEIMNTMIKQRLGDSWPEKGVIEEEKYEEVKALLRAVKADLINKYCTYRGWDTALFERLWPFDD